MASDTEPHIGEHIDETNEAISNALNELSNVRAYTLKPHELRDYKAAQYALRNISPDRDNYDVRAIYDE